MDESTPTSDPNDRPSPPGDAAGAAEFLTLGLTLAVTILVCAALGYLVDRWLGTSPIFTLIGLVLGIAAAVLTAIARVRKYL
jgi:F0F1-type ATP synthase assembly protein I